MSNYMQHIFFLNQRNIPIPLVRVSGVDPSALHPRQLSQELAELPQLPELEPDLGSSS